MLRRKESGPVRETGITGRSNGETPPPTPGISLAPPNAALKLRELIDGFHPGHALMAIMEAGVADQLGAAEEPLSVSDLARRTGTLPGPLFCLLRAGAAIGVLNIVKGKVSLSAMGEPLQSTHPESVEPYSKVRIGMEQPTWRGLIDTLKTGVPAIETLHGMDSFTYLQKHPELNEDYNRMFTSWGIDRGRDLAVSYDFSKVKILADLGGNRGVLLALVLKQHPHLRGLLFDQPHVVDKAPELLREMGVAHRVKIHSGSFLENVPLGADVYLLSLVLHDWDDERARQILFNCHKAMDENSRLLVYERVLSEKVKPTAQDREDALEDLNMRLVTPHGRERTLKQWKKLFTSVDLKLNKVIPTNSPLNILEVQKS